MRSNSREIGELGICGSDRIWGSRRRMIGRRGRGHGERTSEVMGRGARGLEEREGEGGNQDDVEDKRRGWKLGEGGKRSRGDSLHGTRREGTGVEDDFAVPWRGAGSRGSWRGRSGRVAGDTEGVGTTVGGVIGECRIELRLDVNGKQGGFGRVKELERRGEGGGRTGG